MLTDSIVCELHKGESPSIFQLLAVQASVAESMERMWFSEYVRHLTVKEEANKVEEDEFKLTCSSNSVSWITCSGPQRLSLSYFPLCFALSLSHTHSLYLSPPPSPFCHQPLLRGDFGVCSLTMSSVSVEVWWILPPPTCSGSFFTMKLSKAITTHTRKSLELKLSTSLSYWTISRSGQRLKG